MKYSVIIPVYNVEDTLVRCVDSVISLGYSDCELILVNDGSTDGSLAICRDYESRYGYIKVVDKPNGGSSSARNAGLDIAQGEFVLFIDSDDYVCDNFFSVADEYAVKGGLAVFTLTQIKPTGASVREIRTLGDETPLFEKAYYLINSRTVNCPVAKVWDRELIERYNLRYTETVNYAEDFVFSVQYLMHCSDVNVNNISVYMNDQSNQNSISRGRKQGIAEIYDIAFKLVYEAIRASSFSSGQKNDLLSVWDKLHCESFGTCVMELLKDEKLTKKQKIDAIKSYCEKFKAEYSENYGYVNARHFAIRYCIMHGMSYALYCLGSTYMKNR